VLIVTDASLFTDDSQSLCTPMVGRLLQHDRTESSQAGKRILFQGDPVAQSRLVVDEGTLAVELPREVAPPDALAAPALAMAMKVVQACRAPPGSTVAVFGLGLQGHLLARLLIQQGLTVLGVFATDTEREFARTLGASVRLPASAGPAPVEVQQLGRGRGLAFAFCTRGDPAWIQGALVACAHGGRAYLLVAPVPGREVDEAEFLRTIHFSRRTLTGLGPLVAEDLDRALVSLTTGQSDVRALLGWMAAHSRAEAPRLLARHLALVIDWTAV
jgi:threonine dehydrogenase-like Zn-dependent dehydrogenase